MNAPTTFTAASPLLDSFGAFKTAQLARDEAWREAALLFAGGYDDALQGDIASAHDDRALLIRRDIIDALVTMSGLNEDQLLEVLA